MQPDQLHDLWISPDNSRLTTKQFSFRLPVHIAAKIAALGELYPQKNRTQIVADLLTTALDELEKNLPQGVGDPVEGSLQINFNEEFGQSGTYYYLGGIRGRFHDAANQHYRELEKELGNESPEVLYTPVVGTEDDFRKPTK